jgi:hypothetical protein
VLNFPPRSLAGKTEVAAASAASTTTTSVAEGIVSTLGADSDSSTNKKEDYTEP